MYPPFGSRVLSQVTSAVAVSCRGALHPSPPGVTLLVHGTPPIYVLAEDVWRMRLSSVHCACSLLLDSVNVQQYVCCCRILLVLLVLRMIWYFQAAAVSYQVRARCNIMYYCTRIAVPDTRYHAGWCLYIYQVYVKDTGPTGKTRSIPQQIHVHASHYCCCST